MLAGILISSCVPPVDGPVERRQGKKEETNPFYSGPNRIIPFAELSVGDITAATDRALDDAEQLLTSIVRAEPEGRTFANTMLKLDDLTAVISRVWNPAYLMGAVHVNENIRSEADSSHVRFSKFVNEMSANEDLYNAVLTYSETEEAENLEGEKRKYLEETLLGFRRSGFDLGQKKREEVKRINNKLSEIGLKFNRNIAQYQDTLFATTAEVAGLPQSYVESRMLPDGKCAIDMSYPSYFSFMDFSESDDARRRLSYKFLNRAREENLTVLDDMIRKRRELVDVLGYETFADYQTEVRMAKDAESVWQFENNLNSSLRQKANRDYVEMVVLKSETIGRQATQIQPWEKYYYDKKLLRVKYQVDAEKVKEYFPMESVVSGLFDLYQELFGLEFREVENPSVWHEDVTMYELYDNASGNLIGHFYLDLFPRANKYQHAAQFDVRSAKMYPAGRQTPVAVLVCNFPKPTADEPSLLPHDDVETFFHEFGHLLHALLNRGELEGLSVPRDFVEAPSQMLENWVWQKASLKRFARHYRTGETIPDDLVERMIAAKNLNSGVNALQQVYYAILDLTLHDGYSPDDDRSTTDIVRDLQNEITLYPYQDDTHFQAAFGHLYGYAAAYYGYMWSKVYAQDMFSVFEENGILDEETGMRYRKIILEKGGTEDPLELVKAFLGRELNNEAFMRSLGL